MAKPFFILLLFAFAAYGQVQERVAILNTVDDSKPELDFTVLAYLTNSLREITVKMLPEKEYFVMTSQSIVEMLGPERKEECKNKCMLDMGKAISADYIGQARLGRLGGNLTITMELYNVVRGNLIGSFNGNAKDEFGLVAVINEKAPAMFRKMLGVSDSPFVPGGVSGLEKKADYESSYEKRYLAHLNTEPSGAVLSFNGVPNASCTRTPCKVEFREGSVRIIAALEQYETADTTVSIKQNNQNINIRLKANFGVLEINPAYLDGIGKDEQWNLSLNGKPAYSWENRLSPGKYKVELSHRCYETLNPDVGINKGKREVVNMASYITLKKGGLVLSAEADDEPVSEPVFVNGKQVGETPFSGSVPLCAKIEIGEGREEVSVQIKHNKSVTYTHKMNTEERRRRLEAEQERQEQNRMRAASEETMRTAWMIGLGGILAAGAVFDMENIDPYLNSVQYLWPAIDIEFYKRNLKFFRFGFNFGFGSGSIDKDAVERDYPYADHIFAMHFHINTFARLYPVDFLYLSGGVGWFHWYSAGFASKKKDDDKTENNKIISTPVFPIGGGICLGSFGDDDTFAGIFIEGLYNIVPSKGGYISISIGMKGNFKNNKD